jgi:hypothetical protein
MPALQTLVSAAIAFADNKISETTNKNGEKRCIV